MRDRTGGGGSCASPPVRHSAGGRAVRAVRDRRQIYTPRRPLGVVGLITPWNFPAAIPNWKLAPALDLRQHRGDEARRGGPYRLHIAECFAEAGLPAGVLNVITGRGSTVGDALVATRACARSRSPARSPSDTACATGDGPATRVQLELGGHNP